MKFKRLITNAVEYVINIEAISMITEARDGSGDGTVNIYFHKDQPLTILMSLEQVIKKLELL